MAGCHEKFVDKVVVAKLAQRLHFSCPKGQVRTARLHRGAILGTVPGARFEGCKARERGTRAELRGLRTCSEPTVIRPAGPPTSSFGRFHVRRGPRLGALSSRLRP